MNAVSLRFFNFDCSDVMNGSIRNASCYNTRTTHLQNKILHKHSKTTKWKQLSAYCSLRCFMSVIPDVSSVLPLDQMFSPFFFFLSPTVGWPWGSVTGSCTIWTGIWSMSTKSAQTTTMRCWRASSRSTRPYRGLVDSEVSDRDVYVRMQAFVLKREKAIVVIISIFYM